MEAQCYGLKMDGNRERCSNVITSKHDDYSFKMKQNETKRKRYENKDFAVSFHSFEPHRRSVDIRAKRYQDLSNMLKECKRALMKARQ